ncbi:MAG: META domain-containing protein [Spirochaetaceae bacterium]|jgi:heat shock protein HslJ|nr:META domain-containing protein [Spirochaetaceae bacterium]
MYNVLKIGAALGLLVLASCAGKPAPAPQEGAPQTAQTPGGGFDSLYGKEWRLAEVRTPLGNTPFSREKLEAAGAGDFFTLRFDAEQVSGKAAPNRYSGPYKEGGGGLSFGLLRTTKMAALSEPEDLKEQEYYNYLAQTSRWALDGDRLELYTKGEEGAETVLVFAAFAGAAEEVPQDSGTQEP